MRDRKALQEYYRTCGTPKGVTRAEVKDINDDRAKTEERAIVQQLLRDRNFRCAAYGVSPVCTTRARDPHELVRRGAGGKISLDNSVPVCRECHHEADGKIGGNRLVFDWKGKADGLAPKASESGNVWPVWRARKRGRADTGNHPTAGCAPAPATNVATTKG